MAQKRKRNKSWISWVILLVLLIAAGAVVYSVWDNYFRDKKDEGRGQEQETQQVEEKINEAREDEAAVEKKKVEQYDGDDPNEADSLSGAVTYAGVAGNNLIIRVNIDQYLENGECKLTLMRGGVAIYHSITNIVGNASTATCEGFDVPIGELGEGGIEINIDIKSGERSGIIYGEAKI